ncbi:hypothetical protein [Mesorhizobium salmacidum]|uniref:Uncharacterized protein n=1 Tax=Mesorhizobium salmacidum TaxID=3015171 RepID=A0ABU8L6J5_9HYPH
MASAKTLPKGLNELVATQKLDLKDDGTFQDGSERAAERQTRKNLARSIA